MRKFVHLFFSILFFISSTIVAQDKMVDSLKAIVAKSDPDTNQVNALILISKTAMGSSFDTGFIYAAKALQLAETLAFTRGKGIAYKWVGMSYFYQGDKNVEALDNWFNSLNIFRTIDDKQGIANILSNIAAVYHRTGDDAKSLDYSLQSLSIAEENNFTLIMATALQNIGNTYQRNQNTYNLAIQYFLRALPMCEKIKNLPAILTICANLGEVYLKLNKSDSSLYYLKKGLKESEGTEIINTVYVLNNIGRTFVKLGKFDSAISYQKQSVQLATKLEAHQDMGKSLTWLANTYFKQGDLDMALKYFTEAEKFLLQSQSTEELIDAYSGLKNTYAKKGDFGKAFSYQSLEANYKDTLYNSATSKKMANLQLNFDFSQKEKDLKVKELTIQKQNATRNALAIGILLLLIIAFVIYRNYRIKVKTNIILDKQKVQIENLMLNILPSEVATELQELGHATPRYYESVSVLFTDFKSFTSLSDKMSPKELIEELNDSFMAFDEIVENNQLEKIKTIGDAYMCAGGIPTPYESHLFNMIKAGLEMQAFIKEKNMKRMAEGMPLWELRVGIHIGPVVAGVVGRKKYAYDIWGSTVNIASRMESNGAPGRVNISAGVYEQVKELYTCSHRGKISAKNVGEIDMYFVDEKVNVA